MSRSCSRNAVAAARPLAQLAATQGHWLGVRLLRAPADKNEEGALRLAAVAVVVGWVICEESTARRCLLSVPFTSVSDAPAPMTASAHRPRPAAPVWMRCWPWRASRRPRVSLCRSALPRLWLRWSRRRQRGPLMWTVLLLPWGRQRRQPAPASGWRRAALAPRQPRPGGKERERESMGVEACATAWGRRRGPTAARTLMV